MTPSEELVARLCKRSFLSTWSTANPVGKEPGKELCDVLVVCDPDVVIFSVKEIEYKATQDPQVGIDRWLSRAVEASISQVYGAERTLGRLDHVTATDGSQWRSLPPLDRRRVHRVAVALGSKGEIPIADGDKGKGFVHILDEKAVETVLGELDTITDFVEFLRRTETFLETTQVIMSGVEDLLGLYLHHGRKYPDGADLLIVGDDIWSGISAKDEFKRRKAADQESYLWDGLIEHVAAEHDPALTQTSGADAPDRSPEGVTRVMAREDRFTRRVLAKGFREFHQGRKIRSRIMQSPSGVVYVFLATPRSTTREARKNELLGRMFIARGMNPACTRVVGLATEEYDAADGFSFDAAMLHKPDWTADDQAKLETLQRTSGAFAKPLFTPFNEDEYPEGGGA